MSDQLIVQHCSPTLAGIKTGNIFTCRFTSRERLTAEIRRLNKILGAKGLLVLPLRIGDSSALIYIYRPAKLSADLSCREASEILDRCGYKLANANQCVVNLVNRIRQSGDFPHEIGLFLGYPPEDVRGFIDHNARDFKCVGCWKVYGDEEKARSLFAQYKNCTSCYLKQLRKGNTIEQLAVAG